MKNNKSFLSILKNFCNEGTNQEKKQEAEIFVEHNLEDDYGEYLSKPKEYHDEVIKRMYRKTKYADESPDRLREILRCQLESKAS